MAQTATDNLTGNLDRSKFTGCLLGLACGDALGQPVEAFPPERIRREFGEITDFMAGDPRLPMPLGPGQWTDDTQMALDIARSIIRKGSVDPEDIAAEFLADHEKDGIRFSGFTVTYALKRLKKGIPWQRSGLDDEQTAGNGSAMRVAPVGLLHALNPDRIAEAARASSIVTHRHPEAIAGSVAIAYMVAEAASGRLNPDTIIDETVELIGECKVADNLRTAQSVLAAGLSVPESLKKIGTTGWVVHTVAAAAFCFLQNPDDLERTVIDAVMGGDDADTTGAVAGAISGAYNGDAAIPSRWRENVERSAEIRELGERLWELATSNSGTQRDS